jgi:pimeloyl-ACP methyl ester carboxylesterase
MQRQTRTLQPTAVTRRTLDVDGVRTLLRESGALGASEAVVFVHGNPGPADDWTGLLTACGTFARAVAWDHPGYGASQVTVPFDWTVDGYARHLGAVLDRLGIERAHLVLHDFGGPWGLRWAVDHPDRLASVVLVNTGLLLGYRWHRFARIWRTRGLGELFMATTTRAGLRRAMRMGTRVPPPDDAIDRMYEAYTAGTKRAVLALYRAVPDPSAMSADLAATLRPLDRPALVVFGRHDPYIPVEQAERQREAFPSADVHVLEDAGHWPMHDSPERLAAVVLPFLEGQALQRAAYSADDARLTRFSTEGREMSG